MTFKQRYIGYISISLLFMIVSFQNCGRQNITFDSTNTKLGSASPIDETIEICTNPSDCQIPADQDPRPESAADATEPGPASPTPEPCCDREEGHQPGQIPDTRGKEEQPDQEETTLPIVSCADAEKDTFMDAVIIVKKLILVGEKGEVAFTYDGPLSLNGFEVEVPETLSGQKLKAKILAAPSGHYFVSNQGYKVMMTQITGQKSNQRAFAIDVTRTPDGAYLISTAWTSRIHPGRHQCGLLPLTK